MLLRIVYILVSGGGGGVASEAGDCSYPTPTPHNIMGCCLLRWPTVISAHARWVGLIGILSASAWSENWGCWKTTVSVQGCMVPITHTGCSNWKMFAAKRISTCEKYPNKNWTFVFIFQEFSCPIDNNSSLSQVMGWLRTIIICASPGYTDSFDDIESLFDARWALITFSTR